MTVTRLGRPLTAPASLRGTIEVPSDKSIAHRALIFAALADGVSTIALHEPGDDVLSTISALRSLGVRVEKGGVRFRVSGSLGSGSADCGNSGTTMRLLAGALASGSGEAMLTGDASLSCRPMERIAAPLRLMGAEVETTDGHAPLTVRGRRPLLATEHRLPVASAQVLAAICLAALAAEGTTTAFVPGPTRDHTERMLSAMGAEIRRAGVVTTVVGPARLRPLSMNVPGDFSSAAAWIVAATLHPDAEVRLVGVGLNPTRTALIDVLREMGADIQVMSTADKEGEPVGDLLVRSARLRAMSVTSTQVPALIDELPLLAVAMAAADGTSEVRGAAELRVKESDRIATLAAALSATGVNVEELPDGWRISRGRPQEAQIETRGDHRIAIASAVAAWAGVAKSVAIDDPACVAVSYPTFWADAEAVSSK
jgi:3-phosphoshikimate 1-carboxyvinyltransferase